MEGHWIDAVKNKYKGSSVDWKNLGLIKYIGKTFQAMYRS